MSLDSRTQPTDAPDRLFVRTIGTVLAVWLALAFGATLVSDALARRAARASDLALVGAGMAATVRHIAEGFERIAQLPDGPALRTARTAIGWDIDRLLALDARARALSPGLPAVAPAALEAADANRAGAAPAQALAQRDLFAARLAPQAERLALQAAAAAERLRTQTRGAMALGLALELIALVVLLAAVVRPARARLADWVAASHEVEQENRHRLLHDPLTLLPNATYLHAHLSRLAAGADRDTRQTAVMRLDLDRFRTLRDTLGPRTADEILRVTARRIRQSLRAGDFAAYLGQDDFVLVAADLDDAHAVTGIAHRVQAALTKPFSLQGGARRIGASIGVTLLGDDVPDPERTLANAEIALAAAKAAGTGNIHYFRESLRAEAERRETRFAELLAGLERSEFAPYFQPQIDLATGALAGFEALVRWRHPREGLISPAGFLDFAEQADLTERIGEVVLAQSLAALTAWDAAGFVVPKVGVNFAMAQLRDPRLIEKIKWEVERNDVEPRRIAIEVLETVLIKSDEDLVVRNLRGLASAGFQIELDDFGTGHASIQNLRRFMVDRIKIDRTFVAGIEASDEQQTLTASMIAMARALGISTLAEGVESAAAVEVLRRLGCDHFQGYHVARPMSQGETYGWLRDFHAGASAAGDAARPAASDPNMP